MSEPESVGDFQIFLSLMLNTWTQDEMAYMDRIVMHPSYKDYHHDNFDVWYKRLKEIDGNA